MKVLITGGSGFIGTNFVNLLLEKGCEVINFDKAKPIVPSHVPYWREGDIMDEATLLKVCQETTPDALVHFAARTDTLSDKLEDYIENHEGTQHVLNVIKATPSIKRVIITSTQYVYKSNEKPLPSRNDEYAPHTVYGQSKVLTEEYTRKANLDAIWTIVRPTNIWGPWHMRYPNELWKIIDRGFYYHPVSDKVIRTYGYVKNINHQIYQMLVSKPEVVNHNVFYVGDIPIDSYVWLNELSLKFRNKKINRLPTFFFKGLSLFGDVARKVKIPFPIYSERFKNMVEDYPAPTDVTIKLFGQAEADLVKNTAETVDWLKNEGKEYFTYWKNK